MRLDTTTALLALLVPLGALSCSDPGRSDSSLIDQLERVWAPSGQTELAPPELTPPPPNCRSVASQRSVRVGAASGESSCLFDSASSELSCRTALGQTAELTTSEFASASDFVEGARSLGKVTSLREVRRQGDGTWVTSHDFDELGRLVRSREQRAEGDVVYSYRDFDAAGRPREATPARETLAAWGCEVAPFSVEYDDAARSVSYLYAASARCDRAGYSVIERYDVLGNRVSIERTGAEGSETTFESGSLASTQTVCD
jgi:hypothetical protein